MARNTTPADAESCPDHEVSTTRRLPQQVALTVVLLSLLAVEPVAAQENAICSADNLPSMIEDIGS